MKKQKGAATLTAVGSVALVLLLLLAVFVLWQSSRVKLTSPYQAVFLDSGQAYFGKLDGLGTPWSPYVVLTDVYYVQSVTNPETKQTNNILVKRGKEWHAPDRMILNANMIVLVEPVNTTSRVAQLISQATGK